MSVFGSFRDHNPAIMNNLEDSRPHFVETLLSTHAIPARLSQVEPGFHCLDLYEKGFHDNCFWPIHAFRSKTFLISGLHPCRIDKVLDTFMKKLYPAQGVKV